MSTPPRISVPGAELHEPILAWYAASARELPWRAADRTPWGVLVSEVMLQQTPVTRVLPVWREWLSRWPTPGSLAAEPPGEAVRCWGRLGYPRRALRLHAAATVIVARHGGAVPDCYDDLRALPGVGDYTAAAVASFAFGRRHAVLDTNVRRVLARAVRGEARAAPGRTAAETALAADLVPEGSGRAAAWAVAVMELGALVCRPRAPRCGDCPAARLCAWAAAGRPANAGHVRPAQTWHGTDRQCRGRLLAALRASQEPVSGQELAACWRADPVQRARALDSLVADGLVEPLAGDRYRLPVTRSSACT